MTDESIPIRSFRVCFDLERRIHKIDRWRIPLPYGLPLQALGYFGLLLLAVLVLSALPLTGQLLGALHPALRYLVLPAGAAHFLTRWRIDGRSPHWVGLAWLRMKLEPSRVAGFRAAERSGRVELGPVTIAPDERSARLRRGVVEGPAQIVLRYATRMSVRGKTLQITQEGDQPLWRGKQVNLRQGQRVMVR